MAVKIAYINYIIFFVTIIFTCCSTTDKVSESRNENRQVNAQDRMPELIGGLNGLMSRINYPENAKKNKIEGRAMVRFIVDEKGNVTNPSIATSTGNEELDAEALRVVKETKFKPGYKGGEPVKAQFSLPVIFKL